MSKLKSVPEGAGDDVDALLDQWLAEEKPLPPAQEPVVRSKRSILREEMDEFRSSIRLIVREELGKFTEDFERSLTATMTNAARKAAERTLAFVDMRVGQLGDSAYSSAAEVEVPSDPEA